MSCFESDIQCKSNVQIVQLIRLETILEMGDKNAKFLNEKVNLTT